MMPAKSLNEFVKQFCESLPPNLKSLRSEFEDQLKKALQLIINKLELIPREEFDVQTEVLARTRNRVEQLERRVADLEKNLK